MSTSATQSPSSSSAATTNKATAPEVIFYGKMLTFTQIKLHTADLTAINQHLAGLLSNKKSQIPVVINSVVEQDLEALVELLWSWGLQPIGVVTGILDEQAKAKRLAIFPADGKRIERIVPTAKKPTPKVALQTDTTINKNADVDSTSNVDSTQSTQSLDVEKQITSMIYDQMLRSGQSINHVGGDLILTNSVNHGAEAITDNSLHIYGRAQGRLVAGATGDKDARIFCQSFNPTLVSVAGTYCLRDNIPADLIDKPVQVSYQEGEGLVFTLMNAH